MNVRLVIRGIARQGKARFACAAAGLAIAVGSLVFMTSLVATNNAQAPDAARKGCAPWAAWQVDGIQIGFRRGRPPVAAMSRRPPVDAMSSSRQNKDESVLIRRGKDSASTGTRTESASTGTRTDSASTGTRTDSASTGTRTDSASAADLTLRALSLTVDYRPGGHVLQGPPMMALLAEAPEANPYGAVTLTEGRWVDETSAENEIVCVKTSMRRFGASAPKMGEELKFVGRNGTMTAKIVGYLEGAKLPPQFPYVFANGKAFAGLAGEEIGRVRFWREAAREGAHRTGEGARLMTASSPEIVSSYKADEQRRMDFATPLLLAAAFLTALSLLVNSLLLSVESNRLTLATLRTLGMTRFGVVRFVLVEAFVAAAVGWTLGVGGAALALAAWVGCDPATFPAGMAMDASRIVLTLAVLPFVVVFAVLFALRPALRVRPMDAAARRPRPRRLGMAITFACGFAAFVAVEVWGASLMRGFVPSAEWPDAIVSILPGGVSSFDVEKLRTIEGVKRISELVPRQCFFPAGAASSSPRPDGKRPPFGRPNALFLAAEWLPKFDFVEGSWEEASEALASGDAVVITEMMMNAHGLHKGDTLVVEARRGRGPGPAEPLRFPIAGVVDLNWHMVTSRGLVRGLNGAPGMTDGPVFCSLDTIGLVDPRTYIVEPAMSAPMTHLWVEYEPAFLAKHGVFPAGRLIESEIAKRLGNPSGSTVRLHARDEIADGTLAHGSDIIGQAARVPFVFLAILAIGFVAMLVAEADARRREFAVLRAVGATRGQLAGRLSLSAVKTAAWGIVAGFPVGALVGWLFSLKTGSVWPGLPHWFVIPWPVVTEGAIGALVFALVFAIPTALALVAKRR